MKVSIVIPTLNEEKVLRRSLESIKKQKTSHEFGIVIVDSDSKDNTLDIAKEFTDDILYAPPGIIGVARQKGSADSSGEVIVSAGADNIYDERWLEELLAPIAEKRCVATAGMLVPLDGNAVENIFSDFFFSPFCGVSLALGIPLVAGESMAFTRKAFKEVGGYDTSRVTGEDIDLIKKLGKVGKAEYCPKSVTYFSMRRIRKWGYAKYLWFHGTNFFRMHSSGKVHREYERVR